MMPFHQTFQPSARCPRFIHADAGSYTSEVTPERYPTREFRRSAFVPALLAAIVVLAGVALIGTGGHTVILYVTSIFALIISVFAWQARQWWWLIGLVPIAIVWNPIVPFTIAGSLGYGIHYLAALVFIGAGLRIRVRNEDDRNIR